MNCETGLVLRRVPNKRSWYIKWSCLLSNILSPTQKADKIRELQNEWRELGGTSDHGLWQQFKEAWIVLITHVQGLLSRKRAQLKAVNLEKRQEIVAELERYLTEVNGPSADWKAVEQLNRKARQEWKRFFPDRFQER